MAKSTKLFLRRTSYEDNMKCCVFSGYKVEFNLWHTWKDNQIKVDKCWCNEIVPYLFFPEIILAKMVDPIALLETTIVVAKAIYARVDQVQQNKEECKALVCLALPNFRQFCFWWIELLAGLIILTTSYWDQTWFLQIWSDLLVAPLKQKINSWNSLLRHLFFLWNSTKFFPNVNRRSTLRWSCSQQRDSKHYQRTTRTSSLLQKVHNCLYMYIFSWALWCEHIWDIPMFYFHDWRSWCSRHPE